MPLLNSCHFVHLVKKGQSRGICVIEDEFGNSNPLEVDRTKGVELDESWRLRMEFKEVRDIGRQHLPKVAQNAARKGKRIGTCHVATFAFMPPNSLSIMDFNSPHNEYFS